MDDHENLYDKIRELLGSDPKDVNILEDNIDVDLQVEYFEFSKRISLEYAEDWALDHASMLDDPDYSVDLKKSLLARLATLENIQAYKAIESYMTHPDHDLRQWGQLALQESKMHLKSHILEENQVFISTGLGGRGNKLRYFIVLLARNNNHLSAFQTEILSKEFPYAISKYGGEIEDFESSGYLASFMLLLPIQHAVRDVFTEAIRDCNQFGDFLNEDCIITNVRKISFTEVEEFLQNNNTSSG